MNGLILSYHPTTTEHPTIPDSAAPDLDQLGITLLHDGIECITTPRNNFALIDGYALGVSAEQLAAALEAQDDDFLSRVHGHFCAVIIQPDGDILGLCDRYGAKTLYWQESKQHGVIISSRWRDMPVFTVEWDELGLSEMLRYRWTPSEQSLVSGISQLSHQFRVSFGRNGQISLLRKTQQQRWPPRSPGVPFEEKLAETRKAFTTAFDEVAHSYDRAAIFLSGGVDSSLLAAFARSTFRKCLLVTPVFPGNDNPELAIAKAFAKTLGVEHFLVDIDTSRIESDLRDLVTAKGGQIKFHLIALHQLMAAIPDEYRLVIYGESADTLFGFNEFHQTAKMLYLKRYANLLPSFAASWLATLPHERVRKLARLKQTSYLDVFLRFLQIQYEPASMAIIAELATANTDKLFMHEAIERYQRRPDISFRRLLQEASLRCNSANHFREIDLSASQFGKQVFAPYLAEPVFQAAMTLTRKQFLGDGFVKPVLRELACEHYNRDLIYRKKHGFEVPFKRWLKGPLAHLVEAARQERQLFNGALLSDLELDVHYSLYWTLICWQLVNEELTARMRKGPRSAAVSPRIRT